MNNCFPVFRGKTCALLIMLLWSTLLGQAQTVGGTLVEWGRNDFNQAAAPPGLTNVVAVAIGIQDSLAIENNGSIIGWGDIYGEGVIPSGLTNVVAVRLGQSWNVALEDNGATVSWPTSEGGDTNIPTKLSNVVEIDANAELFLARLNDRTVSAWGLGWNGTGYVAVTPPTGLSNVVAIATGQAHAMALCSNGVVVAWGDNTYGQTNVPASLTNAVALAAGQYFCLALKADGSLIAWGDNSDGQTNVPSYVTNVVAIAAGAFHCLALRSDGTIVGWGLDSYGQIDISAGLTNAIAVAAGGWNSAVIINNNLSFVGRQTTSRTVYNGTSLILKSGIIGISPTTYQWQLNGTNISGANGDFLTLTNVHLTDSGNYNVIVKNIYGVTASSNLNLIVTTSSPIILR